METRREGRENRRKETERREKRGEEGILVGRALKGRQDMKQGEGVVPYGGDRRQSCCSH